MRTRMVEERVGEDMGPIDWEHPMAKDMPAIWREAAEHPEGFLLDRGNMVAHQVYAIRMYDGWPYWRPTPSVCFAGTLGAEWASFASYGIHPNSLIRNEKRPAPTL